MLYRVRRRASGEDAKHALLDRFHELQVEIDYYTGWTASEGRWIGRSYLSLIKATMAETKPLIDDAWQLPKKERAPGADEGEKHPGPMLRVMTSSGDVCNHLSLWLFPKLYVVWHNRAPVRLDEDES